MAGLVHRPEYIHIASNGIRELTQDSRPGILHACRECQGYTPLGCTSDYESKLPGVASRPPADLFDRPALSCLEPDHFTH